MRGYESGWNHWPVGLFLLLACIGAAFADDTEYTLRGAYLTFPPLTYTDEQGQPAGSLIDLANQIAADQGYRISWQEMPVRRIHDSLRAGTIDLWPTTAGIPDIQPWVLETSFPATRLRLSAFHLGNTPAVSSAEDMLPAAVILIRGYTYLGAAKALLERTDELISTASDHRSALEMLANKRADYLLDFDAPLDAALAENPIEGIRRSLIAEFSLCYAFSRKAAQVEAVMADFEEGWRNIETHALKAGSLGR